MESNVDGVFWEHVCGWCWDTNSSKAVRVSATLNGKHLGSATANKYRKDLEEAGKLNGRLSFEIALPDGLPDGEYTIRVVVEDTGDPLHGSPYKYVRKTAPTSQNATESVNSSRISDPTTFALIGIAGSKLPDEMLDRVCARLLSHGLVGELSAFVDALESHGEMTDKLQRYRDSVN